MTREGNHGAAGGTSHADALASTVLAAGHAAEVTDSSVVPVPASASPAGGSSERRAQKVDGTVLPLALRERYEDLWLLGEGGMGTVYRGRDKRLGRTVALKLLRRADPDLASMDNKNTSTANRLFRIFDEATTTWAATPWDLSPNYPESSPSFAIAFDGTTLIAATTGSESFPTNIPVYFYEYLPMAPNVTQLTVSNSSIITVSGVAADSLYIYVAAISGVVPGIYRLARTDLSADPVLIGAIETSFNFASMDVDNITNAADLYVRGADGSIYVIMNPGSTVPISPGPISTLGNWGDLPMAYDSLDSAIYFYQTETAPVDAGRIMKLQ